MRSLITLFTAAAFAWSDAASAATPCGTPVVEDPVTSAVFGHLPYGEAAPNDLVPAPRGFSGPGCEVLHRDAAAALEQMLADARSDPLVGDALYGVSCFRSFERQERIYCSRGRSTSALAGRARTSAPPGHSEHATGYTIDFGDRRRRACEVRACFADTGAGWWLAVHARDYGFELSFPAGNSQGVAWEPWHWRWVGTSIVPDGALTARTTFAAARRLYPSDQPQPAFPPFAPAPLPYPSAPVPGPQSLLSTG